MADVETLTLAYVASHPLDAARVLEQRPPGDAAMLFARLPARAGAPVLASMLPTAAARVLASTADRVALSLLTAAGAQAAVAVLRHVPEPRRSRLIGGLPTAAAVAARLLIGYPQDSVGAWSDPQVLVMSSTLRVKDAFERVRGGREGEAEIVYVVGEDQRLLGIVDLPTLVRAPDWPKLDDIMHPAAASLPAVMPLTAALSHPAWARTHELPVVDRAGRLIGTLRLSALTEALERSGPRAEGEGLTLSGFAARGYWHAVSGLMGALIALVPRARPVTRIEP